MSTSQQYSTAPITEATLAIEVQQRSDVTRAELVEVQSGKVAANGRTDAMDADMTDTDEDVAYNPVPPKRVYTVRVKYRTIGQGGPFPFSLEEPSG